MERITTDYLIGVRVEHDAGDVPNIDDVTTVIYDILATVQDPALGGFGVVKVMRIDGRTTGDPEGFDWYGATR